MTAVDCSVVIPTRDRPGQLQDCLGAIAAQTMARHRFEVVVVDDGSLSPVAPLLAAWRDRLAIRSARTAGGGPSTARRAGTSIAGGRWLAFTDDDCVPEPGWLAALEQALRREPGALVGGRTYNLLPGNPPAETSQLIGDIVADYYNADPRRPRFFSANNMAVAAEPLRGHGGFDPAFVTAEDRDLCDRWRAAGRPLVFAPDAVVGHAHRMSLAAFIRQHAGYGRGAYRYMRVHQQRLPGPSTVEPGFYSGLLPRALRLIRGRRHPVALAALLLVWQGANAAGFLQAWGADVVGRRTRAR